MLSSSITLHRKAKDGQKGNDGIGVKNADVMFAVSMNNKSDASKISDSDWKTNFSDLTLKENGYVWACTKITYTSGNAIYTGKYCLGGCYDFAEVTEVYALSDNGTDAPADGMSNWNLTYSAQKGKYLWTCERVRYNQSSSNYAYLNKKCITYFAKDGVNGTSFTPRGTALAHYTNYAAYKADGGNGKDEDVFLIDTSKGEDINISEPYIISFDSSGNECYDKADVGDAYRIGTNLWVNNGSKWVDFGDIQGPKGENGEDALNILVTPQTVNFEVDENGNFVKENQGIYVIVFRGTQVLHYPSDYTISVGNETNGNFDVGSNNKNFPNLSGSVDNTTPKLVLYADGITRKEYEFGDTYNKGQKVSYPASSACVSLGIRCDGKVFNKTININVSFTKMYGNTAWNVKGFESTYGKFVSDTNGKLTQHESSIKQNADSINTLVTKTDGLQSTTSSLQETSDSISARVDAVDVQGKQTQAELDMCVEKQDDGSYRSKMKLYADDVEFTADHYMKIKSGQLEIEAENASLSKDGTLKTKNSEFENVKVSGSMRSDYSVVKSGMEELNVDNICIQSEEWFSFFQLKWTSDQIGRTMRIANYTDNGAIFSTPSSDKYFITNGQHVSDIVVAPHRCLVLHGFGFNDNLIAWCVENSYSYLSSLPQYGMKYLAKGFVIYNSNTNIEIRQKTIGGSISVLRLGTGLYRLLLPMSWSGAYATSGELLVYQVGVMLTGFGYSKDDGKKASPIKATVKEIGWTNIVGSQIYIDVWTSDDASVNDGDFQFLIYNLNTNFDD